MRRVILESPYSSGNGCATLENLAYAEACILDCLMRGESPIASHLLFTRQGILDDLKPSERKLGIAAGHAWYPVANACVIYADHGITHGMQQGIGAAMASQTPIEVRYLGARAPEATISLSRDIFPRAGLVGMSDS